MKKITTLLMIAIMALAWTSCTEEDDPKAEKTKTELLTAHTWKLTAATISPAYQGSTNIFEISPCYQENTESYNSNGSFVKDEGSNKCNNVSQTRTGTWSFNSSETVIQLDYEESTAPDESYNILELSDNTFKYSGILPIDGEDYTLTFTFTAQ